MATTETEPDVIAGRTDVRHVSVERGVEGNEHLTGVTGALLILILAAIGITIVMIHQLIAPHLFIGMMLLGPLGLKLASTGYRFASYYGGRRAYRRKGPPATPIRVLAAPVVLTTLIVMGSGVALLIGGPGARSTWFPLHKLGFIAWIAFMALHVLWHLPGVGRSVQVEYGPEGPALRRVRGRNPRLLLLVASVAVGVVIALISVPSFSAWNGFHGGGG